MKQLCINKMQVIIPCLFAGLVQLTCAANLRTLRASEGIQAQSKYAIMWQTSGASREVAAARPRSWFVKECEKLYEPSRENTWECAEKGVNIALEHWCNTRHDAKPKCMKLKPKLKKIHDDFAKCKCEVGKEDGPNCKDCKANVGTATKKWCKTVYSWICNDLNVCGGVAPGIELPYNQHSIRFAADNVTFLRAVNDGKQIAASVEESSREFLLGSSFEMVAPLYTPRDNKDGLGIYSFKLNDLYIVEVNDVLELRKEGDFSKKDATFWIDEVPPKTAEGKTCHPEGGEDGEEPKVCVFWGGLRFRPLLSEDRMWYLDEDGKTMKVRGTPKAETGRFDAEFQRRATFQLVKPLIGMLDPVATYDFNQTLFDESQDGDAKHTKAGKTIKGGAEFDTDDGISGGSLDLDKGNAIVVDGMKDFQYAHGRLQGMTVVLWFKRQGKFEQTVGLASAGDTWNILMTAGNNGQDLEASVMGVKVGPVQATRHEWHMVALTTYQKQITLYLDGEEVANGAYDAPGLEKVDCPLVIGSGPGCTPGADTAFEGLVDKFQIYWRPLPQEEQQEYYTAGKAVVAASIKERADALLSDWKGRGCFAMAPSVGKKKHLGRPPTTEKRDLAKMPHLKEMPKAEPPAAPAFIIVDSSANATDMEDPEMAIPADAKPSGKPLRDMKGPKPIMGYLPQVKLFTDKYNTLYVKAVDPLNGADGSLSFEACLYKDYFLAEADGSLELRKFVEVVKGDNRKSNSEDKAFLDSISFPTVPAAFAPDSLTLKQPSAEDNVLVTDGDSLAFKAVEQSQEFEDTATWGESFISFADMECPPGGFKLELYDDSLPGSGGSSTPAKIQCLMDMDKDAGDLAEMGYDNAWNAIVKANMDVESDGYYRVIVAKTKSVQISLDSKIEIEEVGGDQIMGRELLTGKARKLTKGIHRIEYAGMGSGNEQGFAINFERVCPETVIENGGTKLTYDVNRVGTGTVIVECPKTHNGQVSMQCEFGADKYTDEKGECIEKKCPETPFTYGNADVMFPEKLQGTGKFTVDCPKTHNGKITSNCFPEQEQWRDFGGQCNEKRCPADAVKNGGATVEFVETIQGTGAVEVVCPATHNGGITRTCKAEEEAWTEQKGECVEKECPELVVKSGGTSVTFKATKQGKGVVEVHCPPTHHNSIKMTCAPEVEAWSDLAGECEERMCPGEEFMSGDAILKFPSVAQGIGEITVECPVGFFGSVTRTCAKEQDQWSKTTGKCVHTVPHFKIKSGAKCKSGEKGLGFQGTVHECAYKAEKQGFDFFVYNDKGKGDNCQAEKTVSARCPEGFNTEGSVGDFYSLSPAGWESDDGAKCGTGKAERIDSAAQCREKCQKSKTCMCAVYYRPPDCKEKDKCDGRTCELMSECEPAKCSSEAGFVTYSKTKCKAFELTSGTAKIKVDAVVSGTADVKLKCPDTHRGAGPVDIKNGGFDSGTRTNNYEYLKSIDGWERRGGTVSIKSGSGPWGGTQCVSQGHFMGLQNAGTFVAQSISVTKGSLYELAYYIAKRGKMGGQEDAKIKVTLDDKVFNEMIPESSHFARNAHTFTAESDSIKIKFENVSPKGDKTVFLDSVSLSALDGHLTLTCEENAVVWNKPKGKCLEKKCPATKVESGGASVSFPSTLQNTGKVTVACPVTYTGSITMNCGPKATEWDGKEGECVEKECPAFDYTAEGVVLKFNAAKQSTGKQTVACPNTHTGSVSFTCSKAQSKFQYAGGKCAEKRCAAKQVNPGIQFPAVKQGQGKITRNCPSGWDGTLSLECEAGQDHYTKQSGECQRKCPSWHGFGKANWWGSFDRTGWSMANGPITGFYRTHDQSLWNIEEAGHYLYKDNYAGLECVKANWWHSFDKKGWSTCPHGYFMHGLYRTGHIGWWRNNQLWHIEEAQCCKPKNTKGYGQCVHANWWSSFDRTGWSSCPAGKAMVGMYRNDCSHIFCLEEAKCCELPKTCSKDR